MPPLCPTLPGTLTPFLYPSLINNASFSNSRLVLRLFSHHTTFRRRPISSSATSRTPTEELHYEPEVAPVDHLNPPPEDYSAPTFADRATITIHSGAGGHGCISFLREKYIAYGPPNGGDGGSGGNVYIQAVRGETSLHKLARQRNIKAGRGKNGQGKTRGGERGEDVIVQVPVGTIVREIGRWDPAVEERIRKMREREELGTGPPPRQNAFGEGEEEEYGEDVEDVLRTETQEQLARRPHKWDKQKWLLYPAMTSEDIATAEFPRMPQSRKSALAMLQPKGPIELDLSKPMESPMLLAAGAVGGLGNTHFVTKSTPRPKFATKGDPGMRIELELELKLLADVGLVGLPNAGKSTLLRAMSRSRTRVGSWAFTTLQPNIGTVVLDNHRGRPLARSVDKDGYVRTGFTIADIPGLIEGAHLDKGLGVSFLRHVERARVLAFVLDLSRGSAVEALKGLWFEVAEYERMKIREDKEAAEAIVEWRPFTSPEDAMRGSSEVLSSGGRWSPLKPISIDIKPKPWFVIATKADLEGTQENFKELREYMEKVAKGEVEHPMGTEEGWRKDLRAIPVSAINGHGMDMVRECIIDLLDA